MKRGRKDSGGQGSIHTGQDAEEAGGVSRHRQFPEVLQGEVGMQLGVGELNQEVFLAHWLPVPLRTKGNKLLDFFHLRATEMAQ